MNRYKSFMTVVLLSFLSLFVMSCEHVSETQNDTDSERAAGADSTADTARVPPFDIDPSDIQLIFGCKTDPCECGEGTGVACVDFSAKIIVRGSNQPVPNVRATALCNETGDPLPMVDSALSDGDGKIILKNVPQGRIGLLIQRNTYYDDGFADAECVNTWHWGVDTTTNDKTMFIMPNVVYENIVLMIPCSEKDGDGNSLYRLSGAAYWMDSFDGHIKPVGCGTITLEPETSQTEFWYLSGGGGMPDKAFPMTDPRNGSFMVCGLLANKKYTVKLIVDDQELVQDCFPMRIIEGEKNIHMLYLVARTAEKPDC